MLSARRWMDFLTCLLFAYVVAGCMPPPEGGDAEGYFEAEVQDYISVCRACHIDGQAADIPGGDKFLLTDNRNQDYANFKAAWTRLGGGVTTNKLLVNPSNPLSGHTGGTVWRVNGPEYNAVKTLFACWEDPTSCP